MEREFVGISERPVEELERELKRVSQLQSNLQRTQQEMEAKERERCTSEQIGMRDTVQREVLLQKERHNRQLKEELVKKTAALKGPHIVKSKKDI